MADVIGIRDDMYIGKGHAYQKEFMDAVTEGNKDGILEQRPTLVNLQCDVDHPTQCMADMLHIIHEFGGVENLKGKKLAMTWAYSPSYGKPLSVPPGRDRTDDPFRYGCCAGSSGRLRCNARGRRDCKEKRSGYRRKLHQDKRYGRSIQGRRYRISQELGSFAAMEKRTNLYGEGDFDGIDKLEKELLAQNAQHKDWACTEELMKTTKRRQSTLPALPAR